MTIPARRASGQESRNKRLFLLDLSGSFMHDGGLILDEWEIPGHRFCNCP